MIAALAFASMLVSAPGLVSTSTYALTRSPARQELRPGTVCRDLSELECALSNELADTLEKGKAWQARAAKLDLKLRAETAAHARDAAAAKVEADQLTAQVAELSAALEDADGVDPIWVVVGIGAGLIIGAIGAGLLVATSH